MSAKYNLHTSQGLASFTDFVEGITREDLRRVLEANPKATGEDIADHFAEISKTHYQGAPGYWGLSNGEFTVLTNDEAAERAVFVTVGDRMIRERTLTNG